MVVAVAVAVAPAVLVAVEAPETRTEGTGVGVTVGIVEAIRVDVGVRTTTATAVGMPDVDVLDAVAVLVPPLVAGFSIVTVGSRVVFGVMDGLLATDVPMVTDGPGVPALCITGSGLPAVEPVPSAPSVVVSEPAGVVSGFVFAMDPAVGATIVVSITSAVSGLDASW